MARQGSPFAQLGAVVRYPFDRLMGYPVLVNLEVTRRCNARCDFCRYWTTKSETHLDDYSPVIRRLRPAVVVVTGGEPFMRRDLSTLVARLRRACPGLYIGLVTNGAMLTVPKALEAWHSGLNQMGVSLDFLDERHDRARGIPGLARHLADTLPRLRAAGIDHLSVNVVIKRDNLDAVPAVVQWALAESLQVVISAYTPVKSGNTSHVIADDEVPRVEMLVRWLLAIRARGAAIASSSYYLSQIPEYFRHGISGCVAGRRFLTVSPAGEIQRCSESPVQCGYQEWVPGIFGPTGCRNCWTSCRGECEAPLDWELVTRVAHACAPRPHTAARPAPAA